MIPTEDALKEAKEELDALQTLVSSAVTEVHTLGFELVQLSKRLDYVRALLEGRSDREIAEYRAYIKSIRMQHDKNKSE